MEAEVFVNEKALVQVRYDLSKKEFYFESVKPFNEKAFSFLTPKEKEIIPLLIEYKTTKQIA